MVSDATAVDGQAQVLVAGLLQRDAVQRRRQHQSRRRRWRCSGSRPSAARACSGAAAPSRSAESSLNWWCSRPELAAMMIGLAATLGAAAGGRRAGQDRPDPAVRDPHIGLALLEQRRRPQRSRRHGDGRVDAGLIGDLAHHRRDTGRGDDAQRRALRALVAGAGAWESATRRWRRCGWRTTIRPARPR